MTFKNPKKKQLDNQDEKAIEAFTGKADISTNTEKFEEPDSNKEKQEKPKKSKKQKKSKEEKVEPYTTGLYPEYKTRIQAIAYQERLSQREVIEQAIDNFYSDKEKLKKAENAFKKH